MGVWGSWFACANVFEAILETQPNAHASTIADIRSLCPVLQQILAANNSLATLKKLDTDG